MPKTPLTDELYKLAIRLKKELETEWSVGKLGNGYHLPTMAAGCEFNRNIKIGFSGKKGKRKRDDLILPLAPMIVEALAKYSRGKKIPRIVFKKHKKPNNHFEYTSEVKYFVGTCAEDNAANQLYKDATVIQKLASLKDNS